MRLVACLATLSVAACAAGPTTPAPVEFRAAAGQPGIRSAEQGDWADGPGTPLSAYALQPEEAHPFDPRALPSRYVVVAGDTVFGISERYQVPLRALIDSNGLTAPFHLKEGSTLRLPAPRLHQVAQGETLLSIARRYSVDPRSLALLNRLRAPYVVRPGEALILPALARPAPNDETAPPAAQTPVPRRAPRPGSGPPPDAPIKQPPIRQAHAGDFTWPVRGPVLVGFGPQTGGRKSDGVDIGGQLGAPVVAAADGRVVYAGGDLPGYGRLILVQHDGGWVTAYAQCGKILVQEGARVRRGDQIAEVGRTPTGETKLHFQLRRGAEPTDPIALLPAA